jgi:hemerythrin-like domain-containing protein
MRPTQVLFAEHRIIEQVLNCLEQMAEQAASQHTTDWSAAVRSLDFFRNFADRCHHGKEEDQLFPMLESKGFSRALGPTGVMLREHDQGRHLMQAIHESVAHAAKGDAAARGRFITSARAYVELLRQHIGKEDHCLFPMADQILTADDQQSLMHSFDEKEQSDIGTGEHEKYLALADQLADQFGVPRAGQEAVAVATHCCHHHATK